LNDDDLSDAIARALHEGATLAMSDRLRDALHQHLFQALRPLLQADKAPDVRLIVHALLSNPHSRASTAALALIGVVRREVLEASHRADDLDEKIRLKNLAACLPVMGA
jgi:hypothetical protein